MTARIKVGLGTAQLGLPYGSQSHLLLMPEEQAWDILRLATNQGVTFIDTAIGYGESEARIGSYFRHNPAEGIQISTKIPAVNPEIWKSQDSYWKFLSQSCKNSRERLGINNLGLLQFHQCDLDFLSDKNVHKLFARLLAEGFCQRIGISVYEPEQAFAALDISSVEALQVPINLLDTRFLQQELMVQYAQKNIFLIARSIFLQGLLCEDEPVPQVKRKDELKQLKRILLSGKKHESLIQTALGFIFGDLKNILDIALIGAHTTQSLQENLSLIRDTQAVKESGIEQMLSEARQFANEHKLISPANWNT